MFHVHSRACVPICVTVVQHLLGTCHSPLHSSSHSIKVTSLCNVPKEPGILPPERQTHSTPFFNLIKTYKRYEIQYFIIEPLSFQKSKGEGA